MEGKLLLNMIKLREIVIWLNWLWRLFAECTLSELNLNAWFVWTFFLFYGTSLIIFFWFQKLCHSRPIRYMNTDNMLIEKHTPSCPVLTLLCIRSMNRKCSVSIQWNLNPLRMLQIISIFAKSAPNHVLGKQRTRKLGTCF